MARLKFDDIDEWTPSSISIVDEPSHPLCKFEVYEDDEDYVKKSIEINQEGDNMVEETIKEPTVEVRESFLEKLLGRSIIKSDEPTPVPPKDEEKEDEEKIPEWAKSLIARIEKLEEKEKEKTPAPGAVPKNAEGEGEAPAEESEEGSQDEGEIEDQPEEGEKVIDEEEVVSKSIDPDLVSSSTSDKSLVERAGRNSNGMTW